MNVTVNRFGTALCTFAEFAERHNLELVITERSKVYGLPRYTAQFKDIEIGGDGMLRSLFGDGNTPEDAVNDYARQFCGHRLVYRAYQRDRHTFDAPNEWKPAPQTLTQMMSVALG